MKHVFYCFGHENIRARHTKTIEFTKDAHLTPRGDCIIGVMADFDVHILKRMKGRIRVTVEVGGMQDTFRAYVNERFDDDHEIVFRKSGFRSKRTLGVNLNKGANRLDRDIAQLMKHAHSRMKVTLECAERDRPNRGRGKAGRDALCAVDSWQSLPP
jgi:hypothetical protein